MWDPNYWDGNKIEMSKIEIYHIEYLFIDLDPYNKVKSYKTLLMVCHYMYT